ncbi:hypothetical protein [Petrachloros mirabilis]
MSRNLAVWISSLAVMFSSGCVMQSTYESVLKESESTKAEINAVTEEQQALSSQASELEKSNAEMMRTIEMTIGDTIKVQREVESQRRVAAMQQEKLGKTIAQLSRQRSALQKELAVSKENTAALKELVEVYKKKVREARLLEESNLSQRENVETVPVPEAAAKSPASVTEPVSSTIPPQAMPPVEPPAVQPTQPPMKAPEEDDSGWLFSIIDWLLSIWRSLFS